jgi:hypothetical protein
MEEGDKEMDSMERGKSWFGREEGREGPTNGPFNVISEGKEI